MPFLIDADEAPGRSQNGLERGRPEISFPLPMVPTMQTRRYVARLSKGLRAG
jgi:hypothetical protein